MKNNDAYLIIKTKEGKIIFNITEVELNCNIHVEKGIYKIKKEQTFQGEFDNIEMITKKWWQFWK